MDGPDE
jgi:hypothetical protein